MSYEEQKAQEQIEAAIYYEEQRLEGDIKHKTITSAIDELTELTGEDFHNYRSEIWNVLSKVYDNPTKKILTDTNKVYGPTFTCMECGNDYCDYELAENCCGEFKKETNSNE